MADLTYRRNLELIRLLGRLGWTPERLAREVNEVVGAQRAINATTPYHWRDRGRVPREPYGQVVCEVLGRALGSPVSYAQLWQRRDDPEGPHALDIPLVEVPWTPEAAIAALTLAVDHAADPARPGDLLSANALHQAGQRWQHSSARPPSGEGPLRIGRAHLGALRLAWHAKCRLDSGYGGSLVRDPLREEVRFGAGLLRHGGYDEETGRSLYGLTAALARLAGWACYDCGEHATAQRYYLAALRAAHISGDRVLGAGVLGCLAAQASDTGDPRDAVALLSSALGGGGSDLPAPDWALLYGRMALAHGLLRDPYAVRDHAAQAFGRLEREPRPYPRERAELHGLVGEAYLALDECAEAVGHLETAVRSADPRQARARALLLVRLAEAYRRTGRAKEAAEALGEAERLGAGMRSPRVDAVLADHRRRFAPPASSPHAE